MVLKSKGWALDPVEGKPVLGIPFSFFFSFFSFHFLYVIAIHDNASSCTMP